MIKGKVSVYQVEWTQLLLLLTFVAPMHTFRFLGGEYQKEELERAEYYAKYYGLNIHYVDII